MYICKLSFKIWVFEKGKTNANKETWLITIFIVVNQTLKIFFIL